MRSRLPLLSASSLILPLLLAAPPPVAAPEPWVGTYSIVGVDPEVGEIGVAVTSRVPCVGNLVPHLRPGVGVVVTQAAVNAGQGEALLELLGEGVSPREALDRILAGDPGRERRQIGILTVEGASAQHTGSGAESWAGHASGRDHIVQGNILTGPEVLRAVSRRFESTAGSGRSLAERLIDALAAGEAEGGDARRGVRQSAVLFVTDGRREGTPSNRYAVDIEVCEHPAPVAELLRIHRAVDESLGYRELQQFYGNDVIQLKEMLHALGYFRPHEADLRMELSMPFFDAETARAVDAFREAQGLTTIARGTAPGLVDLETVEHLWAELERRGLAAELRRRFRSR